jgi:two-component system, OmpR family, phosphate regulon sensor histidine kinase PhoR
MIVVAIASATLAVALVAQPGSARPFLVVASIGAIAILPAWAIARWLVRPLTLLQGGAERMARGEFGERLHGGAWRESRELAGSFNEMSRRLVEQIDRLVAEQQHLRAILDGMTEGVIGIGSGQRVIFANEAAGRMLDFDVAAAVGRPLYEIFRQPAVQAILEKATESGRSQREDLELTKPSTRHLSVHVALLAERGPAGAVLVLNDNSELRRLERLRHEFVANVSHELKTPLSVMRACVETLQDGAVEDPNARGSFLQQIAEGADRLHALILDLLSLARIESGQEVFEYEDVPVAELVAECIERQRPRADAKGRLMLNAVPPPQPCTVWADPEAFGQILDNLVDNAVKYTQPGGTIRIRWNSEGDSVVLQVEDNGPGIPERDLSRIFERFYRVDKARSRELGGTGLGLSIVKHLTQTMRGAVAATSRLGDGTTFTVTLPRSNAE